MRSSSGITIGSGISPIVREIKCRKCGLIITQRQKEGGLFDKIEKCPRCGHEGRMDVLRHYAKM